MIDFWFDFSSTYSAAAALRIEAAAKKVGQQVRWRPFLLGAVFAQQPGLTRGFQQPERLAYMQRDLERTFERHFDLKFKLPPVFPVRSILANRLALAVMDQPWAADFIRGVFLAAFVEGRDISEPPVLNAVFQSLEVDGAPYFEKAGSDAIKQQLRANTDEAIALGVFGAPNFVVKGELFWGQDRLEDALWFATK